MKNLNYLLSAIAVCLVSTGAFAQSTWNTGAGSWNTAGNWTPSGVPNSVGAVANFNLTASAAITLDNAITIGGLNILQTGNFTTTIGNGTGGTLTWATSSGTPTISVAGNNASQLELNFTSTMLGSQGLTLSSSGEAIRFSSGINWSGFSGTLTVAQGYLDPQAGSLLPVQELVLGTTASGTGNLGANLGMTYSGSPRSETVGGLNGNSYGFIANNNFGGISTLTVGSLNENGSFAGTIGKNSYDSSTQFRSMISVTKTGTGTQVLSGANYYGGTTTISGGSLLVDGTHTATIIGVNATSINTGGAPALTTGQGGKYQVNSTGTLGGTGTIKPFDTLGGTVMINVNSGGILAPGDLNINNGIGTLTLDGSASSASLLILNSGATLSYNLNTGLASSQLAIVNAQVNDVFFNNNIINFNDLTAGSLSAGQYILFSSDSANTYNGLTTSGSVITSGLSIGTGLAAYNADLQVSGNDVDLDIISPAPEPSGLFLGGLGLLALLTTMRRSS
ncbi:MAG TPA: autotransporter-associated beta strand repeat-containing protein [Verrucomicrobiae bacterium]|jgi:autotransporter-associated beta strand protein